jgi:hypothetical protein
MDRAVDQFLVRQRARNPTSTGMDTFPDFERVRLVQK